ncbi:LacI family DNA-binding transcriptional regulator [Microbacterium sp. gxy059]|uniref:LacI family DNA-binding transcriptional regulator n=1 Tax=Microbacterium sp. gxy059 TaxID=2957199 RepID=UPI003D98CCFE
MADVARAAGVSRTAVSFVLNERDDVMIPEATRDRIHRAATDLGYRRNAAAQALAKQSSGLFGLVTEIVTSPFAVDVIRGAQQRAWEEQRFLLIAPSEDEQAVEAFAIEKLLEQRVEGILLAATWHRAITVPDAARELPCVLVNCYDEAGELPSVVPDEVSGGRRAASALIEAGHERIGHVTLTEGIPAQVGRLEGFRAELAESGRSLADDLIRLGDGTAESGYLGGRELLERADRPTAIFCGNDRIAMGVYDAAKELGLSIPGDLSVVGFDNQEILAAYLRPGLTTVALPFAEMGSVGVSTLASLTAGRPIADMRVEIDCPLHARSSVGPVIP